MIEEPDYRYTSRLGDPEERGLILEDLFERVLVDLRITNEKLSWTHTPNKAGFPDFLIDYGDSHIGVELKNWKKYDTPTRLWRPILAKFDKVRAYRGYLVMSYNSLPDQCLAEMKAKGISLFEIGYQVTEYNLGSAPYIYRSCKRFLIELLKLKL